MVTDTAEAILFRLQAPGNKVIDGFASVAAADKFATDAWHDFRAGLRSGKDLPRVLVEIGLDGHQHVVKTYPEESV